MKTPQFNRDDAIALCRAALRKLPPGQRPSYASNIDLETFHPHEWAVQALFLAYSEGLRHGRADGVAEQDDRELWTLNAAGTAAWRRLNALRQKSNTVSTTVQFLEQLLDQAEHRTPLRNDALLDALDRGRPTGVSFETFVAELLSLRQEVAEAGGWVGTRQADLRAQAAYDHGREDGVKAGTAEARAQNERPEPFEFETIITSNEQFMEVMTSGLGTGPLLSWLRGQVLAFSLRAHAGNGDSRFRRVALDRARTYNAFLLKQLEDNHD